MSNWLIGRGWQSQHMLTLKKVYIAGSGEMQLSVIPEMVLEFLRSEDRMQPPLNDKIPQSVIVWWISSIISWNIKSKRVHQNEAFHTTRYHPAVCFLPTWIRQRSEWHRIGLLHRAYRVHCAPWSGYIVKLGRSGVVMDGERYSNTEENPKKTKTNPPKTHRIIRHDWVN